MTSPNPTPTPATPLPDAIKWANEEITMLSAMGHSEQAAHVIVLRDAAKERDEAVAGLDEALSILKFIIGTTEDCPERGNGHVAGEFSFGELREAKALLNRLRG